jgi:uroporphyrinogen III methyltransferase / synthase
MNAARPLAGKRVVVTRPREQAADLVRRLEELGAEVSVLPVIAIEPPADWSAVDSCLRRLGDYDWLVFSSANGVEGFFGRLAARQLTAPPRMRIAVVGPSTAAALARFDRTADLIPAAHRAETLAAELASRARGQRFLIVRGEQSRDILREELARIGSADEVIVYRQRPIVDHMDPVWAALTAGRLDWVTLTSSNIARAFFQSIDAAAREQIRSGITRLASISPLTSATIRELGFAVAAEAELYTIDGMLDALVTKVRGAGA